MSLDSIRACLEHHILSATGLPQIVFPNVFFDPDPKVSFVRVQFVPVSRRPANIGPNPLNRYEGMYQLNVHTEQNIGEGPGLRIADILTDHFGPSTAILFGGQEVGISYSETGLPFPNSPFYTTPVTVGWYAYAFT